MGEEEVFLPRASPDALLVRDAVSAGRVRVDPARVTARARWNDASLRYKMLTVRPARRGARDMCVYAKKYRVNPVNPNSRGQGLTRALCLPLYRFYIPHNVGARGKFFYSPTKCAPSTPLSNLGCQGRIARGQLLFFLGGGLSQFRVNPTAQRRAGAKKYIDQRATACCG